MRRTIHWVSPVLAVLVSVSALAAQNKKDADKDKPQTKEKMLSSGKFIGKLVSVEGTTKNFTVQVEYYEPDQRKALENAQYDATRRIQMAAIRNNPAEYRKQYVNHLIEMKKRERDMFKKLTKNVELAGDDNIKVRRTKEALPINYDDKGKVRPYTKKELAEMKAPEKRITESGAKATIYVAEFDNLHKDQIVEVYLAKQEKKTTKPKAKKKDKDKDSDKENDKDLLDDRLPAVKVIILAEPVMKDK
jgi:hypothetical protein